MKLTHSAQRLILFVVVLQLATGLPPIARRACAGTGSIRLDARPNILLSDGHSTATITASVRDSGGNLVPDGTQVRFTTTAGTITEVVLTSSGSARATLTSSSLPGTADVSAFVAEGASATVKVQMVASLADVSRTSPVINVEGKYVAYSEGLRVIEAMEHAVVRFEGLRIEADAVQVDLNREAAARSWQHHRYR